MQLYPLYHGIPFFSIAKRCSNSQFAADIFLKFTALYQLSGAHVQDKGAAGHSQLLVDFVDADVAVGGGFPYGQCHFLMNRDGFNFMRHGIPSFLNKQ